jgi:O-acetylhomoserine/O-acetylserine sulfhydrylase-like pyridoxal-dependent enzyme
MSPQVQRPETLALHAGWRADAATGARAVPIYQTCPTGTSVFPSVADIERGLAATARFTKAA